MKNTKRIATCGIMCALSIAVIYLATITDLLSLCGCYAAALIIVFIRIEYGSPSALTVYAVTAVVCWLILPDKLVAVVYTFAAGIYPIVKPYADKIKPKWLALMCKLAALDIELIAVYAAARFLFRFEAEGFWLTLATIGLADLSFILMDVLIDRLTIIYLVRYRDKLHRSGIL